MSGSSLLGGGRSTQPAPTNIYTQSNQALTGAIGGATAGMNYQPMNVTAGTINPATTSATGYSAVNAGYQGYNPATARYQGYNAANAGSQGYNAALMQAGQLANTNLNPYMNPYESSVIQGMQSDAQRAQQMSLNDIGASASAAGAFGGSRHGIAEGTMLAENQRNLSNQVAGLRQAGFQNAQQMALTDIANQMAASQANQNALNQAGAFGAQAANTAALQNAAARNQASQFGASAYNQAALANQAARNAAGQFGASAYNQAQMQNAMNQTQARAYGAQATNAANMANMNAINQARQMNVANQMQAGLANQQAGLAGAQQRLSAAGQLGTLSNLGFGMGQQINQQMMQQGALQQALQQAAMDRAAAQYTGYQQSPYTALDAVTRALSGTPYSQTQTTEQNRGLFDYLGMGLYGAGALGWKPFG